jgi:hypothetical protein
MAWKCTKTAYNIQSSLTFKVGKTEMVIIRATASESSGVVESRTENVNPDADDRLVSRK